MVISPKHQQHNIFSSIALAMRKLVQTWLSRLLQIENPNEWQLRLLTFCLELALPFNRSHHLRVLRLTQNESQILLPLRGSNTNHLGGLHACALVTAGELSTGTLLLKAFPPTEYRLLLSELRVEYKRQGFTDTVAICKLSEDEIARLRAVAQSDKGVFLPLAAKVVDGDDKVLCTVEVRWHLKLMSKTPV
jgi:acyl-coenzyme A thioesterase PaaI-like protein